ncbi:hypothetical protein FACS1894109_14660 [Spirochaetia bacterium]|nr:hypothetical protein FACS1894109_14660 [Spirochaetia bacterium]
MAIKVNKDHFISPQAIFVYYMLASALGIMIFRLIFQGEKPPIPPFAHDWRLNQGVFDLLTLYPALVMSALVIPFGLRVVGGESSSRFSPAFLKSLTGHIIIAISAAVIYGLLFFLVLPRVQDDQTNMRSQGQLYRLAQERAKEHAEAGDWSQVSQFVNICEGIWPGSPEMEKLKEDADAETDKLRILHDEEVAAATAKTDYWEAALSGLSGQRQPVSVLDALTMAETARQEERYYDAHWLATLAGRQAKPGSPEAAEAARAATLAWNKLNDLAPNARETKLSDLYHLKQSGYQALVAGEWIRAYYIFREFLEESPADPDAAKFLAKAEEGTHEIAFFTDEMDLAVGEALTGAVYSIPVRPRTGGVMGRAVLRFQSISYFSDVSYGFGLEFVSFNGEARPDVQFQAPFAKIIPFTLDGQQQILVMMRALDRNDRNKRWEPAGTVPGGDAQIILDLNYENFLLLSRAKQGADSLSIGELFTAAKNLGPYGYISQVFEAEAIYRLCEPLIFLPMAIFVIIIGWRYRAKKRPKYIAVPMLFVLPLVFNGLVHLYRYILNTLGIWAVLNLGFSNAMLIFTVSIGVLFVISLISLAFQQG